MITVFQSLTRFFKVSRLYLDNNVFRLHYKFTAGTLLACAVVAGTYQFFGQPIKCHKAFVRQELVETFCWVHATYSIPEAFDLIYGKEVVYPGVDKSVEGKNTKVYHQYYQWVCFMLMLQAIMFIIPHFLWKANEGGRIKQIVMDLDLPILQPETKERNKERLVDYLLNSLRVNRTYFIAYMLCELLNFINVVGQIYLIDRFLGYSFTKYGLEILTYTEVDIRKRPDYMSRIFPKMTKCTYHIFGSSGTLEVRDVLCILPLNVINEKIYAFMWFWFLILAAITGAMLLYRIVVLLFFEARYRVLIYRCPRVHKGDLRFVLSETDAADWFIFNQLAKNLDPNNFKDVISSLAVKMYSPDGMNIGKKGLLYESAEDNSNFVEARYGSAPSKEQGDMCAESKL